MNIEEYISSGILESYVLGQTTESENALIICLIKTNPQIAEEIRLIENSFEHFAQESKIIPPSDLKDEIWSKIQKTDFQTEETNDFETPKALKITKNEDFNSELKSNYSWLKIAASIIVIVSFSSLTLYYFNLSKSVSTELALLEKNKADLEKSIQQKNQQIGFLNKSTTKKVILKGVPTKEKLNAVAHWCPLTNKLVLSEIDLPQTDANKQYQLWAIVDGKPVSAGMLESTVKTAFLDMKSIPNSDAFAITLEPKGGSESPHLDDLCVIGEVK